MMQYAHKNTNPNKKAMPSENPNHNHGTSLLFRVNGTPQGKSRPRFTKSGNTYTPAKTRHYEQAIRLAARNAAAEQAWLKNDEPLRVHISAWFAVPKSWPKYRKQQVERGGVYPIVKPDADNIAKVVCDALNEIAYSDDKQIVECVVRKLYCRRGDEEPHIEVSIEPMLTLEAMQREEV